MLKQKKAAHAAAHKNWKRILFQYLSCRTKNLLVLSSGSFCSADISTIRASMHASILPQLRGAAPVQRAILDHLDETGVTAMGTTLVAAFFIKNRAALINVGDSRAYHFSSGGVRQITTDHSMVELMVQRGELTREQAKNYPGKNVITRAVGTEQNVEGDLYFDELKKDDCLLLCTDGLSNVMADQEMLFEVVHGVHKSDCCQRLLNIAKTRGAPDNVTVTLAAL